MIAWICRLCSKIRRFAKSQTFEYKWERAEKRNTTSACRRLKINYIFAKDTPCIKVPFNIRHREVYSLYYSISKRTANKSNNENRK